MIWGSRPPLFEAVSKMYNCYTIEILPFLPESVGIRREILQSRILECQNMPRKQVHRTKWVNIRLTPDEFKIIEARFKKTMYRKISEYTRNVLLEKAITIVNRDKSMDDVLEELILLRKELNFIGINFNQAVRKLNSVSGMPEAQIWQSMMILLRDQIEPSIGQIKERMNNYSDLWSQRLSAGKA
ncbi:plasmid mobilization relaxosome protein MobC [Pedobacter sp. P351]|uniref:plasmid mobilization protein n=1 Tax=Pedobacter superstes TaxID=3133441 RepID=UPI0030A0B3A8